MPSEMDDNGTKGNCEPNQSVFTNILRWIVEIEVLVILLLHVIGLVLAELNSLIRNKML